MSQVKSKMKMRVIVEYAGSWFYHCKGEELKKAIKPAFPKALFRVLPGPADSFEIKLDGKLIYSKLESGGFPVCQDVVNAIEAIKAGQPVQEIGLQPI